MNHHDERIDAYLWDPAAPPENSVVDIERRLAPARFDAGAHPLPRAVVPFAPASARRRIRTWLPPMAWAAAALVVLCAGLSAWRWTWPDGRAWTVLHSVGTADTLAVGATLRTQPAESALVRIARIGTMELRGHTAVTLHSTTSNRHRLALQEGSVRVRVWAPPFSVAFRTPAGEVADLGCEFDLTVTGSASQVRVRSGWVQLENVFGEVLVPAGASSEMTTTRRPSVAVYDDAVPEFKQAVIDHQLAPTDPEPPNRIAEFARPRDVYTMLQLAQYRSPAPAARQLMTRAAQLFPPPDSADVARAIAGDVRARDRWITALPLPSPKKSWWWNWRDGFFRSAEPAQR